MPNFHFDVNQFRKSLVKRYVLAMVLIGVLATLAFLVLIAALKQSDDTAHLVNLSGKQRMLTQTVALDSFRLHQYRIALANTHDKRIMQDMDNLSLHLISTIDEMASAHQQLSQGRLLGQDATKLSAALNDMYFGSQNVSHNVESYLELARNMVNAKQVADSQKILSVLSGLSEPLLPKLNKLALMYQAEGEDKLHFVKNAEIFVWVLTLFVLLLETIFIFQPFIYRLMELAKDNLRAMNEIDTNTLALEQANKKLADLAYHDPLTGLHNRLNLERDIETTIAQYQQYGTPFAVFMLDIDWFKKVNDNYGHDAGDFVLKSFASLLEGSVRHNDLVYRAGGEEFVILFAGISLADCQQKAEEIRLKVESHVFQFKAIQIHKTVSIGLYHSDIMPPLGVKSVLKEIDEAMYRSKALGRNRVSAAERSKQVVLPRKETCKVSFSFPIERFKPFAQDAKHIMLNCLVPSEIDGTIGELVEIDPQEFTLGNQCLRTFIHPDDSDIFERFIETGAALTQSVPKVAGPTLLWGGTIRIILPDERIKVASFEVCFMPQKTQNEAKLVLMLCESQEMQDGFTDALMVYNFHAMLDISADFVYFKDQYHVFTAASKTMAQVTNVNNRSELVGKTDYDVVLRQYADQYYELEKQLFTGKVDVAQAFQPYLDQHGQEGWIDHQKYPIKDQDGKITGIYGIAQVINEAQYQQHKSKSPKIN